MRYRVIPHLHSENAVALNGILGALLLGQRHDSYDLPIRRIEPFDVIDRRLLLTPVERSQLQIVRKGHVAKTRACRHPSLESLQHIGYAIFLVVLLLQAPVRQQQSGSLQFVGEELRLTYQRPYFVGQSVDEFRAKFYRTRSGPSHAIDPSGEDAAADALSRLEDPPSLTRRGQHPAGRQAGDAGADNQTIVDRPHSVGVFTRLNRFLGLPATRVPESSMRFS